LLDDFAKVDWVESVLKRLVVVKRSRKGGHLGVKVRRCKL
jgi:hypothetical protein